MRYDKKEIKFRESMQKQIKKVEDRERKLFNEIRKNASKQKADISYNDIEDLKIDLELFGRKSLK
jgi:rRNA maturation endonuclease Nob1